MDNTEKARELINKHLYLHGGDGLGINDGDVYRAVLDAVCEALTIPVVTCRFDLAWIGQCKNTADESGFCKKHKDIKCVSCGEQATHECSETMGLVCGAPLCDNCEHTIQDNGCNSGGKLPEGLKSHCKKSEQVYLPWYTRP